MATSLQDLFAIDYQSYTKQQLSEETKTIVGLIRDAIRELENEYAHGDYHHNFKQTFKHLFKKHYISLDSKQLQLKKDLVSHYRDMLQADMSIIHKHNNELLEHDILDREMLQRNQKMVELLHEEIVHLGAAITTIKEYLREGM